MDIYKEYTSPLSTKGQITIPQKVREILQLETGDTVKFLIDEENKKVIVEKEFIKCSICKGEKVIEGKPCFACSETGIKNISSNVLNDIVKLDKYGIIASFINTEAKGNEVVKRMFPLIELYDTQNLYSQQYIDMYHDFLQTKALIQYAGDKQISGDDLLKAFKTEEAKELLQKQLNPFNDIFEAFFGKNKV